MRKLCTHEVGGVKMKKTPFAIRKNVFSFFFFLVAPLVLHFKNDL
jgi:hypothetical protein